jgi:hypothetical protein
LNRLKAEAGEILTENLQDMTVREGLSLVDWKPEQREYPMAAEAVEWWLWGKIRFFELRVIVVC